MQQTRYDEATKDSSAVSVFGNTSAGDFPVLKAFQEYIDAEQAKARKRMIGLSIFFVALMALVVITFMIFLSNAISRNQALTDKLLEFALKERNTVAQPAATPIVVNAPSPTRQSSDDDANMQPILEKLTALTSVIQSNNAVTAKAASAAPVIQPESNSPELYRLQKRIEEQADALGAEREKLRAAQEKLRQLNIEAQRRVLYPQYYANQQNESAADNSKKSTAAPLSVRETVAAKASSNQSMQDPIELEEEAPISDIKPISYFDEYNSINAAPGVKKQKASKAKPKAQRATAPAESLKPDKTIDYVLPLDSKKDGQIPWHVYIPE